MKRIFMGTGSGGGVPEKPKKTAYVPPKKKK